MMLGAKMVGHKLRVGQFVVAADVEANGKSAYRLGTHLAHHARDDAGVHAAAQHCAHWNIGLHSLCHRATHMAPYALNILRNWTLISRAKGEIPIALFAK